MKNCLKSILKYSGQSKYRSGMSPFRMLWSKYQPSALFVALFLTAVFLNSGHAETVIDSVVAIVGDEIITQSDLDRLALNTQASDRKEDRSALIHRLIEERLILQEVRRKRVTVSDAEIEYALNDIESRNRFPNRAAFKEVVASENQSWRKYVADLENQLMILKLLGREVNMNIKVDEKAIRRDYDVSFDQYKLPDRVHLSRLLLKGGTEASEGKKKHLEEKLAGIYSELEKGTAFIALVKKYSEGPRKDQDGELGFFNRGDLAPELEKIIATLKAGEVSPPHHSAQNIQIFKVNTREAGRKQDFEKVKKEIEERLLSKQRAALQEQWIAGLFEQTYVDIK